MTMHDHQIRVVVADLQPLFRDGLARAIRQDRDLALAGEACDRRATLEAIRSLRPEVAVVGADAPELDAVRLLAAMACEELATKVVVLAPAARPEIGFDAVAAGACGCLAKRVNAELVCDAVRRVAAGDAALCAELQTAITREIHLRHRDDAHLLPPQEHRVVRLMAEGMTNREIAARLHVAPTTVKSYNTRIYQRLGARHRAHAVAEAHRRGLLD